MAVDLTQGVRLPTCIDTREETTITARLQDGTVQLANGRMLSSHALWPLELEEARCSSDWPSAISTTSKTS